MKDRFTIICLLLSIWLLYAKDTTVVFQQGMNGYDGCKDSHIQINGAGAGNYDHLSFHDCPS